MNDELNNGGEALDMRDTKTFVEALTRIPNVGTDADFQRINDKAVCPPHGLRQS